MVIGARIMRVNQMKKGIIYLRVCINYFVIPTANFGIQR